MGDPNGIGDPNIMPNYIGDPGIMPNTIGDPNISVALNPQPFPPAPGDGVALNPQPFPPAPGGDVQGPHPWPWAPGANPGPLQTGWKNPGPIGSRKAGATPGPAGVPFVKFRFGTVFTTKVEWESGEDAPTESITFLYGTLAVNYYPKKRGDFDIKDWSFGIENPTTIGSATGGAGSGKSSFGEFSINASGDEIATDKYGRVKVKFFWDRDGKTSDDSSGSASPCTWCPR